MGRDRSRRALDLDFGELTALLATTTADTHLLVYRAADVNRATADRQRAGTSGGIAGHDLGAALPTSGVTGAAFIRDPLTRALRLLISLNQGTYFEVVAYRTGVARDGSPKLLGTRPISESP